MIIWGKVIGAVVGGILYGPVGILLGLVFGQVFDNGLRAILHSNLHPELARSVFFKSVFQTMGYLAKADGVVSEKEISVARDIMLHDFNLNHDQMLLAMHYFNDGKQPGFDLAALLATFKRVCGNYADLRRFFLELQVKAVMADGVLRESERGRLVYICSFLGIPLSELEYQLRTYGYTSYNQDSNRSSSIPTQEDALTKAYRLLGVTANDSLKTVKTAYRRLISKYHPDKLVAKGLPPEMMTIAKEKAQQITVAYDLIVRSRE